LTDVVDSSALATLMGDRAWAQRIDKHLAQIANTVHEAGGTLVKSLGDGTMSTFTSTRAALRSAARIQSQAQQDETEPALRVRIGLHSGEVIENKGDFFGTVVNTAARINAVAQPVEIRISDATRLMLGRLDGFDFDDPRDVELKGLEGRHRLYRLRPTS
jgi:class 3 adenylate cyclase